LEETLATQKTLIDMPTTEQEEKPVEEKYSTKIQAPIYEPKNQKPHVALLCDDTKTKALIREIEASNLPEEEKKFLIEAAHRHSVFHYEKIADYYAHASSEMQDLMEKSALVIIDFHSAVEYGYVRVCALIHEQYLQEHSNEPAS
jgi:hypothetical protein